MVPSFPLESFWVRIMKVKEEPTKTPALMGAGFVRACKTAWRQEVPPAARGSAAWHPHCWCQGGSLPDPSHACRARRYPASVGVYPGAVPARRELFLPDEAGGPSLPERSLMKVRHDSTTVGVAGGAGAFA